MTDEKRHNLKQEEPKKPQNNESKLRSKRKEQGRQNGQVKEAAPKKKVWVQIRLLPIWLRIILVLVLLIGAALLGTMIGYGSLGDGNPTDVFKKETWTHILDIINGVES